MKSDARTQCACALHESRRSVVRFDLLSAAVRRLEEAHFPLHRIDELGGVITDCLLEHHLHVSHIADARRRIARQDDEVGLLA